jgi:hypothetical protein
MLVAVILRTPDWMVPRTPYWFRLIGGAGIVLTIGAFGVKILPMWLGWIGFALLIAFFVVVIARVLEPLLAKLGIWRGRTRS